MVIHSPDELTGCIFIVCSCIHDSRAADSTCATGVFDQTPAGLQGRCQEKPVLVLVRLACFAVTVQQSMTGFELPLTCFQNDTVVVPVLLCAWPALIIVLFAIK